MYKKIREYCLKKKETSEDFPFGPENAVFKVNGKLFGILNIPEPQSLNLKCEPELAIELRKNYKAVTPGYHMNKEHWNTIALDGSIELSQIENWIDMSYFLVIRGMAKKHQRRILGE